MRRIAVATFVLGALIVGPSVGPVARATIYEDSGTQMARPTPAPSDDPEFTTSTRTEPGVGSPARHDQFATQGWRGVAFVLLALVMIAWILRARARDPKIPPDVPWPDD